jgi:hypothetical protein
MMQRLISEDQSDISAPTVKPTSKDQRLRAVLSNRTNHSNHGPMGADMGFVNGVAMSALPPKATLTCCSTMTGKRCNSRQSNTGFIALEMAV